MMEESGCFASTPGDHNLTAGWSSKSTEGETLIERPSGSGRYLCAHPLSIRAVPVTLGCRLPTRPDPRGPAAAPFAPSLCVRRETGRGTSSCRTSGSGPLAAPKGSGPRLPRARAAVPARASCARRDEEVSRRGPLSPTAGPLRASAAATATLSLHGFLPTTLERRAHLQRQRRRALSGLQPLTTGIPQDPSNLRLKRRSQMRQFFFYVFCERQRMGSRAHARAPALSPSRASPLLLFSPPPARASRGPVSAPRSAALFRRVPGRVQERGTEAGVEGLDDAPQRLRPGEPS